MNKFEYLSIVLVTIHVDMHAVLLHQGHKEVLELRSVVVDVGDSEDYNTFTQRFHTRTTYRDNAQQQS